MNHLLTIVLSLFFFSNSAQAYFKKGSLLLISVSGNDEPLAIERIKVGDMVLSFDDVYSEIVTKRVERILRVRTYSLVEIEFENGQIIETTKDHLFYVADKWVEAGTLYEGDVVSTNKDSLKISSVSVSRLDEPTIAYDIQVESNHNYFVIGTSICTENERGVLVRDSISR